MPTVDAQSPLPAPIPSITAGDEVVAVDLTAETSDTALVLDFSGTQLILEAGTTFAVGDAMKVEHRKGLLLGEVVDERPLNANCQVVVRCYEWLGKQQLKSIRQKSQ